MTRTITLKTLIFVIVIFVNLLRNHNTVVNGESHLKSFSLSLLADLKARSLEAVNNLWENSQPNDDLSLLQTFKKISENISQVEIFINPSDFSLLLSDWSNALIYAEINNINKFYEMFLSYQADYLRGIRKPTLAWTDLAETYLQKSELGVIGSLEKIHKFAAAKTESENMFRNALKEIKDNVCDLKQSPHQVIYNLYNNVALAELKGNLIIQFSYMLLNLFRKNDSQGNFIKEAKLVQNKYDENFKLEMDSARNVLKDADRSIFRCDPKQYVEGVNYEKLTRLLQGYIENEVNLNPYGTCSENCDYYKYADYNGCYKHQFCSHQPECQGKIIECRFIDSDMNICISSNLERRYDWIEYENKRVLGSKGICEYKNFFKVDSWWRYLFWHCSYCLCLCDDSRISDRYFNLRNIISDIHENKVVTGVKLIKQNQIIHIQIQQGVLKPRGVIDNATLSWKPVENYNIEDVNVENNVDYHMMTWSERSIDIDDIFGPPEHVVTGVRFRKLGGHLNLEIRVTPINFATGQVYKSEHSFWKGNDNTEASFNNPRSEIKLDNPDIPIRKGFHNLNSKPDQFVQFQATSFETDAGQSTVPFIDSQPLTSAGFPLSGMGLIHRGKSGSGGFIAPKLISYNFAPHLK